MYITDRFSRNEIEKYEGEKKLQKLHTAINSIFKVPKEILEATNPVLELNEFNSDQAIYTFSFVRHPYTRYYYYYYIYMYMCVYIYFRGLVGILYYSNVKILRILPILGWFLHTRINPWVYRRMGKFSSTSPT